MLRSERILLISGFCLSVAVGICADPPALDMARELGYSEILKEKEIPHKHFPRAPKPSTKGELSPITESSLKADAELLKPKVYQKAEPASMIPFLLTLQQRQPDSPKIARKLAMTCLQAGQPREALYWFTKVWELDKSDLAALWNMAALSYRLGDMGKAEDFLKEYARRDPYSAWGMVARKFIDSGALNENSAKVFDEFGMPRIGYVEKSSTSSDSEGGLMIVEGRRVILNEEAAPSAPSKLEPRSQKKVKVKKPVGRSEMEKSQIKDENKQTQAVISETAADNLPIAPSKSLDKASIDTIASKPTNP